MSESLFVGRKDSLDIIQQWINGDTPSAGRVSILAMSGPGGVGKSRLFAASMEACRGLIKRRHFLQVKSIGKGVDPFDWIRELASSIKRSHGAEEALPNVGAQLSWWQKIKPKAEQELAGNKISENIAAIASSMLKIGRIAASNSADLGLGLTGIQNWSDKDIADAAAILGGLNALVPNKGIFHHFESEKKRDFRADPATRLAEALVDDLADVFSPGDHTKRKHGEYERLIWLIDDIEALAPEVLDFLVEKLMPRLAAAKFDSHLAIVGRDSLAFTHLGWRNFTQGFVDSTIDLHPLGPEDAIEYCCKRRLPQDVAQHIYEQTEGYPLFLELAVDEHETGGLTAPALALFYERTQMWMTVEERDWFKSICYLPRVNEDTLRLVIVGIDEIDRVMKWFEKEGSIRDPRSPPTKWRMRKFIQERALTYFYSQSPERFKERASRTRLKWHLDERTGIVRIDDE